MSRAGVGCRVLIDGRQLDDGCIAWANPPDDALGEGVVIDEALKITWGRATVLEQPQSSACLFTVTDDPGGLTYVSALQIGAQVDVYADAIAYTPPVPRESFKDGDFETTLNGWAPVGSVTRSNLRAKSGAYSARVKAADPANPWSVVFAPDALQAPGQNPGAWDAIAKTDASGQAWQLAADIYVADGVQATLYAALFTGPYQTSYTLDPRPLATTTSPGGGWQHLSADYTPTASGAWVGVVVQGVDGRTWDQLDPTWTWNTAPADLIWDDFGAVDVDNVSVLSPEAGTATTVLVFSGRITDLEAVYDDAYDAPRCQVTASDFLADLGNRPIGDEPWPAEPLAARVNRILQLAAVPGEPPIVADIAPSVADTVVSWHDVDRQAAAGLLTDLAQSVDGVMWSATHIVAGPFIRIEDPSQRVSMARLTMIGGVVVIAPADFGPGSDALELSACDMLRDPVTFVNDVGDIGTRVRVEWLEQTTDQDGLPTTDAHTEVLVDDAREAVYGSRSVSVSTLLTTAPEAVEVAERILSRTTGDWRAAGLTVDDAEFAVPDDVAARAQLRLLSGTERGGLPVYVTDMPDWAPTGNPTSAYVEGGEYTFSNGGWALGLVVSRATGLGESVEWDQLDPSWAWNQFDPNMTWNDLHGVSGP